MKTVQSEDKNIEVTITIKEQEDKKKKIKKENKETGPVPGPQLLTETMPDPLTD